MIPLTEYRDRVAMAPSYFHAPWFEDLKACTRCACRAEAAQVVAGEGPLDATVMVLGQNPGDEEDQSGRPFVGRGGKELDEWLARLGLARPKILVTNVVHCHTTKNRAPKAPEVTTCTGTWLRQELETFTKLQVVIPLGKPAAAVVLGKTKVPTLDPFWIQVAFGARVLHCVPLPHPAYLLRSPGKKPELYARVLPAVVDYLSREVPEAYARARP